jgi:hypothetical protein
MDMRLMMKLGEEEMLGMLLIIYNGFRTSLLFPKE